MINLLTQIQKIKITPKVYLNLPDNPGVYIFFKNNTPIYIGKAINLKKRVASYFRLNLETKTFKMISEAEEIGYINVTSDLESLLLEAKLIKTYLPKYNIISKDDKHPLYIQITNDQFPRVLSARKQMVNDQKLIAIYGPFPSSANVKSVLNMIRRIIPFSDHKLGKKACLYSQIGLCNPCPNEIKEIADDKLRNMQTKNYKQNIRRIKAILDGKIEKVKKEFVREMTKYSKNEEFEKAADVRNKIQKLDYITSARTSIEGYLENPNFAEDLRDKELSDLKSILGKYNLEVKNLERIECFDVAHLQGSGVAASMAVFIKGVPDKSQYRHFRIHQQKGNDDYSSMREVALRRKRHFDDWGVPNLIIVDGGKGQLSVFLQEFAEEGIPIIGLAKRFEILVIPGSIYNSNNFVEYKLTKGAALNLVEKIRNEAHRFAQIYHHKLISKGLFERH